MKLKNPNLDSSFFENLENKFKKKENLKLLDDSKLLNEFSTIITQANIYNRPFTIMNLIQQFESTEIGNNSKYYLHIVVDLGYKHDKYGQRDLGCNENLWIIEYIENITFETFLTPIKLQKSKVESQLHLFLNNLFSRESTKSELEKSFKITTKHLNSFRTYLNKYPNIEDFITKSKSTYFYLNQDKIVYGDYQENLNRFN